MHLMPLTQPKPWGYSDISAAAVPSINDGDHYSYYWWRPRSWLWSILLLENCLNSMVHTDTRVHIEVSILNQHWRTGWWLRCYLSEGILFIFQIYASDSWFQTCNSFCCLWYSFNMKLCWCQWYILWPATMQDCIISHGDGDSGDGYDLWCCLRIW